MALGLKGKASECTEIQVYIAIPLITCSDSCVFYEVCLCLFEKVRKYVYVCSKRSDLTQPVPKLTL